MNDTSRSAFALIFRAVCSNDRQTRTAALAQCVAEGMIDGQTYEIDMDYVYRCFRPGHSVDDRMIILAFLAGASAQKGGGQ